MKITDMTREQLRDYMKGPSREIHRYSTDSVAWKHAFSLIRKAGYENLDMDCNKCVSKVKEWIEK